MGLNVLSEVALSEAAQLTEETKRSKTDFHILQASGPGNGIDFKLGVPDEKHHKTSGTDEGTGTIPGVHDVPKYDYESEKESCGYNGEEDDDDDENDSGNESNNGDNDDDGDDDDDDVDNTNDDDEETGSDRTELDRIKIPILNQSSTEYYEEKEDKFDDDEKINDKEKIDEEEDDEIT
nr:hypothetical protein [Tanacetum cinerariifolium]